MAKYFDADGNELPNGHGYICTPRKTVQHDAVPAVAHHEHYDLAGDHALDWDVVDKPAVPAWGEVTEYTCTPLSEPILEPEKASEAEKLAAQVTYTAMMTDTMLPESEE